MGLENLKWIVLGFVIGCVVMKFPEMQFPKDLVSPVVRANSKLEVEKEIQTAVGIDSLIIKDIRKTGLIDDRYIYEYVKCYPNVKEVEIYRLDKGVARPVTWRNLFSIEEENGILVFRENFISDSEYIPEPCYVGKTKPEYLIMSRDSCEEINGRSITTKYYTPKPVYFPGIKVDTDLFTVKDEPVYSYEEGMSVFKVAFDNRKDCMYWMYENIDAEFIAQEAKVLEAYLKSKPNE